MTYTPNQLRELAVSPFQLSYEAGQDICNAFADLIERYELLKKHAEAMANAIDDPRAEIERLREELASAIDQSMGTGEE